MAFAFGIGAGVVLPSLTTAILCSVLFCFSFLHLGLLTWYAFEE